MTDTVICAGLRRSGSTWLFNVVRTLLNPKHTTFLSPGQSPGDATVIKTHSFHEIPGMVLLTIRDFREVVASCMRRNSLNKGSFAITDDLDKVVDFQNVDSVSAFLQKEKENYLAWRTRVRLILPYAAIRKDKFNVASIVARILHVDTDVKEVLDKVEGLKIPSHGCDLKTHLWANHITDGGEDFSQIPAHILSMIEKDFPEYLSQ